MRRGRALGLVPVVAGALVLLGGVLAIHRGYHHDLYDAFFLPVIAHRVTLGAGSADDIAWRIHEFVNLNLRTPSGAASLDGDPRPVLLRGYAFCDQAVLAFIRLLQEKDVRVALTALLEDFTATARGLGMAPVILFIPDEPGHRDAFDDLVTGLRATFGGRAAIAAVRGEGYQWDKYLPNPNCHPGVYGYRIIAEHAARAVREADGQSAVDSPRT